MRFISILPIVAIINGAQLYPESARHLDPCLRLCGEFSADRRGAGETLCEFEVSRCIESWDDVSAVCTYLYWSQTDDGQAGIVYSQDDSNLVVVDPTLERIVTCEDAAQILYDSRR